MNDMNEKHGQERLFSTVVSRTVNHLKVDERRDRKKKRVVKLFNFLI